MSKFNRKARVYDEDMNFSTSLRMGVPSNSSKLYNGPEDDHLIDRHGGMPLFISGRYTDTNFRYAIINSASSCLFYPDGSNLNLMIQPFIMDTKTFIPVNPLDIGYTQPLPEITYYAEKNEFDEITNKGGVENYITFLFQNYNHINTVAKTHN
jgi:hypothetical protein